MAHPDGDLAAKRFLRMGAAVLEPLAISRLLAPELRTRPRRTILRAGCFSLHFSRALVAHGFGWQDIEPTRIGLNPKAAKTFHTGAFRFRTGNIHTPKMRMQWLVHWSCGISWQH